MKLVQARGSRESRLVSESNMRWRRSALYRPRVRRYHRFTLRHWVVSLAWRGLPLFAFGLLCFPAILAAAKPQAASSEANDYDNQLELRAHKLLLYDQQLASHNLGVTVRDSSLTVWGTLPSEELARRAKEKLREIPGVVEVRSDLRIERLDDPVAEFLNQPLLKPSGSRAERTEPEPRRTPGELTGRTGDDKAPATPNPRGVVLLKPIALATAGTLAQEVERLRLQDARFRTIKTEIQGKTVYLRGDSRHRDDLQELARRASRLAGVEHVIVREVRGE